MFSYIDEITYNCLYAILTYTTVNFTAENFEWLQILYNVLFNLGYMYTAIFNLVVYDETQVKNYAYFLSANIGDFLMRFLFRDKSILP